MQRALSRAGLLFAAVGLALIFTAGTTQPHVRLAADPNPGDVWTDNVGQPSGPGHEQDPHLTCTDINIWGAGLADSGGTYVIDGWPPSGSQETDYSGTWSYATSTGGSQVIATVSVSALIANATANGDAPVNRNGFHFKLVVSQDPKKSKVFWVACGGGGGGGGATPTPTPVGGVGGATPTPTPVGGVGGATPTPTPVGGVGGATPTPTPVGGVAGATPTPTPVSGVLGISTTPTPSGSTATSPGATGGVLGISTSVPFTGTPQNILGWIVLTAGLALMFFARSKRVFHLS